MKKTKKILALVLTFVFTIVGTVGVTVAYLTDTDKADNTFTLGNVEIELVEQQRKEVDGVKTNELEAFVDGKVLLPLVGSAQNGGYPTAANYVDKIVDVKNVGLQDAYVRVLMAFPADMDADTASDMMMHWNVIDNDKWLLEGTEYYGDSAVTIDGREYNIYCFTYQEILDVNTTTEAHALIGVYIDSRVDATAERNTDGEIVSITYSMVNSKNEKVESIAYIDTDNDGVIDGPQILVFAQAIQSAGFDSAAEAFAASNFTLNPWAVQ